MNKWEEIRGKGEKMAKKTERNYDTGRKKKKKQENTRKKWG